MVAKSRVEEVAETKIVSVRDVLCGWCSGIEVLRNKMEHTYCKITTVGYNKRWVCKCACADSYWEELTTKKEETND